MRFRLIYDGPLHPTGNRQKNPIAGHKQDIRRVFHAQLKHLWATNKFLSSHELSRVARATSRPIADENAYWGTAEDKGPMAEVLAEEYQRFGYRFVPLVRDEISLLCSLSILFLRRDVPGSVITAGDLDNRLKTLIDALRCPQSKAELVGYELPALDEDPFYCLMEDDKQVTHLEVETDTLLDPPKADVESNSSARVVITVELRPYYATMFNLSFS